MYVKQSLKNTPVRHQAKFDFLPRGGTFQINLGSSVVWMKISCQGKYRALSLNDGDTMEVQSDIEVYPVSVGSLEWTPIFEASKE